MCGIAGYIGKKNLKKNTITDTLDLMKRRGPDNQDWWSSKCKNFNIHLLHSRLKIIDLDSSSNQPYFFKNYVLIFNGEIYNYLELKNHLKTKGHKFYTNSDTEVLIKCYAEYGTSCVKLFNGMWSFALWDKEKETLLISRDRFGEKPIYFFQDDAGFYFGSEVKFIFSLLEKKLPINFDHLYRYLVNGYKSLFKINETFFKDIKKIAPSTNTIINNSLNKKIEKYWQPKFEQNKNLKSKEVIDTVRELMKTTVKYRLRSDVPIAFCMSGGVDSNSLISIAKNILGFDVHGFTIVNEDGRYDERSLIKTAVEKQNLQHTEIPITKDDFLPNLTKLIAYHDSPISTITYFVHWLLIKSISNSGYKISISGTGADELFSGYFDHHLFYLKEMKDNNGKYNIALKNWKKYILPFIRNPLLKDPSIIHENLFYKKHIFFNAKGFSEYLNFNWEENFQEKQYSHDLLRNRMANEIFNEVVPVILHEDDMNSMYFSVENRSPYLDHELFDFCQTIPTEYLICEGYAKSILRQAMRGVVPDKILFAHKKVGFNAPILSLLDINENKTREYLLDDSPIYEYISREKIEKILKEKDLPNSSSKFLFNFINAKIFIEMQENNFSY